MYYKIIVIFLQVTTISLSFFSLITVIMVLRDFSPSKYFPYRSEENFRFISLAFLTNFSTSQKLGSKKTKSFIWRIFYTLYNLPPITDVDNISSNTGFYRTKNTKKLEIRKIFLRVYCCICTFSELHIAIFHSTREIIKLHLQGLANMVIKFDSL